MKKLYKMPGGICRWYEEGKAPVCAEPLVIRKAEEPKAKAIEEPENKAVEPANKAKKGSKKK